MGHWVLIIKPKDGLVEFFDSLGCNKEELDKLRIYGATLNFNEERVQGEMSTSCGLFCLYVAFWRLCNLDLSLKEVFSNLFSQNFKENEILVHNFYSKYTETWKEMTVQGLMTKNKSESSRKHTIYQDITKIW